MEEGAESEEGESADDEEASVHTAAETGEGSAGTVSVKASTGGMSKRGIGADRPPMTLDGTAAGPKKMKVVVKDAAWSTWWAVLYWAGYFLLGFITYLTKNSYTQTTSTLHP